MTEADSLPHVHAFLLDPGLKTSASAFATMAPGLEAKLREDVSAAWGVGNGDVVQPVALVAGEGAPVGVIPIHIHAITPPADAGQGAEAKHGDDPDGDPTIDVFEDLILQYGIGPETPTAEDAMSCAIDHELTEYRIDPTCDRTSALPDGRVVAVEACDQVQAQTYRKLGVCVSNFNTPSNFGIDGNAAPFDHLGMQLEQFQCEPGGYEQVLDPSQGWQMITADLVLHKSPREMTEHIRSVLRDVIDDVPNGMLRYRLELAWRDLGRHCKRRRKHRAKH